MEYFKKQFLDVAGQISACKSTDPIIVGRVCFIPLSQGRKARLEFVATDTTDGFKGLQITILSQKYGKIDTLLLLFGDYIKPQETKSGSRLMPHIWVCDGEAKWYGEPTDADKAALSTAIDAYICLFT